MTPSQLAYDNLLRLLAGEPLDFEDVDEEIDERELGEPVGSDSPYWPYEVTP
jgi:hypothetical protein